MPYRTSSPPEKTHTLTPEGRKLWVRVFNKAYHSGKSEESAHRIAWAAARQAGLRKDSADRMLKLVKLAALIKRAQPVMATPTWQLPYPFVPIGKVLEWQRSPYMTIPPWDTSRPGPRIVPIPVEVDPYRFMGPVMTQFARAADRQLDYSPDAERYRSIAEHPDVVAAVKRLPVWWGGNPETRRLEPYQRPIPRLGEQTKSVLSAVGKYAPIAGSLLSPVTSGAGRSRLNGPRVRPDIDRAIASGNRTIGEGLSFLTQRSLSNTASLLKPRSTPMTPQNVTRIPESPGTKRSSDNSPSMRPEFSILSRWARAVLRNSPKPIKGRSAYDEIGSVT